MLLYMFSLIKKYIKRRKYSDLNLSFKPKKGEKEKEKEKRKKVKKSNCKVVGIERKLNVNTSGGWLVEVGGRGCLSDLRDRSNDKSRSELFQDDSPTIKLVTRDVEREYSVWYEIVYLWNRKCMTLYSVVRRVLERADCHISE